MSYVVKSNSSARKSATEIAQQQIERVLAEYGPFLSLSEASRRFLIPLPTLADAVRGGRLNAMRLFGRAYVRPLDVEAYRAPTVGAAVSLADAFDQIAAIGEETQVPHDFARNLDHHLYGADKVGST
jgi:hypothetical protein